jgi:hypothetical protein
MWLYTKPGEHDENRHNDIFFAIKEMRADWRNQHGWTVSGEENVQKMRQLDTLEEICRNINRELGLGCAEHAQKQYDKSNAIISQTIDAKGRLRSELVKIKHALVAAYEELAKTKQALSDAESELVKYKDYRRERAEFLIPSVVGSTCDEDEDNGKSIEKMQSLLRRLESVTSERVGNNWSLFKTPRFDAMWYSNMHTLSRKLKGLSTVPEFRTGSAKFQEDLESLIDLCHDVGMRRKAPGTPELETPMKKLCEALKEPLKKYKVYLNGFGQNIHLVEQKETINAILTKIQDYLEYCNAKCAV